MPARGAKKRETKSARASSAGAVTITPRVGTVASRARSGASPRTTAALSTSTSQSKRLRPVHVDAAPSESPSACGAASALAGSAGKSSSIQPARRSAMSTPLFV